MRKFFTIVVLTLCIKMSSFGQPEDANIDKLRNVIPPSPNSAAFAKYGDWPVNLYTGVPSIDIPLLSVKGRTVSVPVSLSYHASGNRVAEVASWVGLGWSLNTGGVISRSVRGLIDEGSYFASASSYSNPNDLSSNVSTAIDQSRIVQTARNEADSEQDIYNFSAMGKSYRLLIMADGSVKTSPHSNLKFMANPIQGSFTSPGDWEVLMEDGTKLLFGGSPAYREETTNPLSGGAGNKYNSSWMLKSVTSANGETITYTYAAPLSIEQDAYFSQTDNIKYRTSFAAQTGCALIVESVIPTTRPNISIVSTLNLASIESDLERLDFVTVSGRQDLFGGVALAEVKLWSKVTNQYTDRYVFNTTYSTATSSNAYLGGTTNLSYFNKRLRLVSLEKKDVITPTNESMKWTFDYDPQNLPSRRSYAQDYWGYYNGEDFADGIIPRVNFSLPNDAAFDAFRKYTGFVPPKHLLGARKTPNATFMKAEMLTGIHYPTGGFSQFNFEPNGVQETVETWQDANESLHMYWTANQNPFEQSTSVSFTMTRKAYVRVVLSSTISQRVKDDRPNAKVIASIATASGSLVGGVDIDGTYYYVLDAGAYTFTLKTNLGSGDFSDASANIDGNATLLYEKSNGVTSFINPTGGLRVASIVDYDGTTAFNAKYYEYANPLVISPIDPDRDFITTQSNTSYSQETGLCICTTVFRSSSSKVSGGSIQGGSTGYGTVTVKNGLNGVNGYSVSTFNSVPDEYSTDPREFPYPPPVNRDNRRGLLLTQKDYSASNVLLRQVDNTYDFAEINSVTGFKAGYYETTDNCQNMYNNCGIIRVFVPIIAEQTKHLTSQQTMWDENGANPITTKTYYYYTTPANLQPVRTVTFDSHGDSVTVVNKTAFEMNAGDVIISAMLTKNMITQPHQQQTYNNATLISETTTTYANTWPLSKILPAKVETKIGNGATYTSVMVNAYDEYCNPVRVTSVEGVSKGYIWDYKSSRPIAEVTNCPPVGFAYTSFESDGTGNWNLSTTARDVNNAFIGSSSFFISANWMSVSGLSSTASYVVSLWCKAGGTININSQAVTASDSRNGWNFFQKTITGATTITVLGTGFVDDVRLHPVGALMSTYTYGSFGISTATSPTFQTTYYSYDGHGRLTFVQDHLKNVIKSSSYHYKAQ